MSQNKLIFITGGSGSGKSTLSHQIINHFGDQAILIAQDNFYFSHQIENYDVPEAMDFERIYQVLNDLKNNITTTIPIYDFVTNSVIREEIIEPKKIIIFEGLFSFYDYKVSKLADFKIFVDTPSDIRLARRILRDIKSRKRDLDSILDRWVKQVHPSYDKYIRPMKKYSNVVVPWIKIKDQTIEALLATISHIKQ